MLWWILQTTLLSIVFILLVHHLINFFKNILTVPKIKDLVNEPRKKYKDIYNIINSETKKNKNQGENENTTEYTLIDILPKNENDTFNNIDSNYIDNNYFDINENNMKNELKNFLKSQLK